MAARTGSGSTDVIELKRGIDEVRTKLQTRVALGESLRARVASANINAAEAVKELRDEVRSWDDYNDSLLPTLFSGPILREYRNIAAVGSARADSISILRGLNFDLDHHLRKLKSIIARLELWVVEPDADPSMSENAAEPTIFLVHGHDEAKKEAVARAVERATSADVVVLHERVNLGRTLIEKFEEYAGSATFAIINLTGDDVGKAAGASDLNRRARQNVVFEMGFFFGALGRHRVAVLVDAEVEKPSDVDGIVYVEFDAAGGWKRTLMREIEAAGFKVDHNRIP